MTQVTIWCGNPTSGGTGYCGEGKSDLEAFMAAYKNLPPISEVISSHIFRCMARAQTLSFPIVRLGDAGWSVEVKR